MPSFKQHKLSYACAMLCAAYGSASIAQTASSDAPPSAGVIEEVFVTATFRQSLASAIYQKRDADTQIEAIGLEDIGRLPAKSIADAIATLPGVAGARTDAGTISQLSVRGTTDLTLGTLNGREQVTVDSTRNVEFSLYPPNVMTSVQVYKTGKATLTEGGLAGVINMKTIRPLDFDEPQLVVIGEVQAPQIADDVEDADDWGAQGSIMYVGQPTDNFGYAISYAYADEVLAVDGDVSPFEWRNFAGGFGAPPDVDGDGEIGDEVVPGGFTLGQQGGSEERDSLFLAAQWSGDVIDVNWDLLSSRREQDFLGYFMNFVGTTGAGGTVTNPVWVPGGGADQLASATITIPGTNATGFGSGGSSQSNQQSLRDDEVLSSGINFAFNTEDWTAALDVYYSEAEQEISFNNTSTQLAPTGGFGGPTFTLTYDALRTNPTLAVQEDMLNPAIWVPRQYDENVRTFEDELFGVNLDFERQLDLGGDAFHVSSVMFGGRYTTREKTFGVLRNRFNSALIPDVDADGLVAPLDASYVTGAGTPRNGPAFPLWNPTAILNDRFANRTPQAETLNPILSQNTLLQESGAVEEDSMSAYVQLNFEGELGVPFTGNVGVRVVDTETNSPGWTTPDRASVPATPINPGHSYTEYLPSFNVSFELTEDQMLRVGVGKVMNRAPLDDLKSSQTIFISGFGANGFGGNPELDPTTAIQSSISYEWYPTESASLVVAAFYNDLDSFIGTEFETIQVVPAGGLDPVDVEFETVGNGDGGYIRGFEFAVNSDFGFINEALDSFGTSFNYAFTESNVTPVGAPELGGAVGAQGAALTGLSEDVANLALWWAANRIEARIGVDYRSEYIEPSVFGNFLNVDSTTLLSLSLNYDVTDSLRLSLLGTNIGDEQRRKYSGGVPQRTEFNSYFGETWAFRIYYKM